ncbi:MAG: MoaD/ThiS family protein [Nitrospira sp.]|jgi:molybdopterin synthase sulfur carrier subunit|nr:MoaD/ThiS family protein [Nitrospira sp.]
MIAHIPSALRSYTAQQREVPVEGATLAEALAALDRRYPGIRFRIITEQDTIRPHIRIFVNDEQRQDLNSPLQQEDHLYVICALSGG